MTSEQTTFAERLREACGGVNQVELARELDITQGHLSSILAGLRPLGPKTARKVVRRFPELRDAVADLFLTPA